MKASSMRTGGVFLLMSLQAWCCVLSKCSINFCQITEYLSPLPACQFCSTFSVNSCLFKAHFKDNLCCETCPAFPISLHPFLPCIPCSDICTHYLQRFWSLLSIMSLLRAHSQRSLGQIGTLQ